MEKNIFVFDVEATNLHGTGFAVGAVVLSKNHIIIDKFELLSVEGAGLANGWVKENVIPHLTDMPTCAYNYTLRQNFYDFYVKHKETSDIWADCCFPVETNFLSEIHMDKPNEREFNMPYPLKDISTVVDINIDRNEMSGMKNLKKHNPYDDALASAIVLLKHLEGYV